MNVLALNCGSSSVKFRLLAVDPGADVTQARALAGGIVDRLGPAADVRFEADGRSEHAEEAVADHADAVDRLLRWLAAGAAPIDAVGHRVVHGGARFVDSTPIDDTVLREVEELESLAPLHNRPSLAGVRACRKALPTVPMVAVFDTAFHAKLPEHHRPSTPAAASRWPTRPRCGCSATHTGT
jgi:acetate kinase